MPYLVDVNDKQMGMVIPMNAKRALYLATAFPQRFSIVSAKQLRKELNDMARLAQKYPVKYQEKLTLEQVRDEELKLVSIEEKEGTSGTYFLLRVERPNHTTGYISMGFAPICDALRQVDPKKDLPGEVLFTKTGSSWIMK